MQQEERISKIVKRLKRVKVCFSSCRTFSKAGQPAQYLKHLITSNFTQIQGSAHHFGIQLCVAPPSKVVIRFK